MIQRFREVVPKKMYRGSAPSPMDVMHLKDKLGIKKIVSLDRVTGDKIDRACKLLGIVHIKLYIDENIRKGLLDLMTSNMKKLFLEEGPVYVHCLHGKDRTGLVCALVKCKFLGMSPEEAINEAKSMGFGVGVNPAVVGLYEKLIRSVNKSKDENNVDIVSQEREYKGDNRDSFLDEVNQGSFAPYLDHTRQNPQDALYTYINDQSPTRQNYPDTPLFQHDPDKGAVVPNVGEFDNDAGQRGFGPSENYNGFFSEVGH